jgi:tetratricopeptide (TPR) repeat protein
VAGALERLWFDGGLTAEGRYWIERAQAGLSESEHPLPAARLWRALGRLSSGTRKRDAAEHAIALYQSVGDGHGAAKALLELGYGLGQMGRTEEAAEACTCALTILREFKDDTLVAACLDQLASLQLDRGDLDVARELYALALAAYKTMGDETGVAMVLGNLAELDFKDGKLEQALRLAGEALEIRSSGKNPVPLADRHINIAAYRLALGNLDGAREAAHEGLRKARQAQYALGIANAVQHFASLGAVCGQARSAAQLVGYVNAQYTELGLEREYTEKWSYEKLLASLRGQLSEAETEKLAAEGATWSEDQALEEALKL